MSSRPFNAAYGVSVGTSTLSNVIDGGGNIAANDLAANNITANTLVVPTISGLTDVTVAGNVSAQFFNGNGLAIEGLDANNIASGTLSNARLSGTYNISITGSVALANVANFALSVDGGNIVGNVTNAQQANISNSTVGRLLFASAGNGAAAGSNFNGNANTVISYNSIGAPASNGAGATGTWPINIGGTANIANTVTANAQPNITSVGNLVSLTVDNTVTANLFSGSGANLSFINGANIVGGVPQAQVAVTVSGNVQPNINQVGQLNTITVNSNTAAPEGISYMFQGQVGTERMVVRTSNDTSRPSITMQSSRGNLTNPTVTANNDQLGYYVWGGYDGANWQRTAWIRGGAIGTWSNTNLGTYLAWDQMHGNSNVMLESMRLANGNLSINTQENFGPVSVGSRASNLWPFTVFVTGNNDTERIAVRSVGANTGGSAGIIVQGGRGNLANPDPTLSGDTLGTYYFGSRAGNIWSIGAYMRGLAEENHTLTARGTGISIETVAPNSNVVTDSLYISGNRNIGFGTKTPNAVADIRGNLQVIANAGNLALFTDSTQSLVISTGAGNTVLDSPTGNLKFTANTVFTGNVGYTGTDGTVGQVLTTYGNGTTYWSSVSASNRVVITADGTWTVPPGVGKIRITAVGGGGGGGDSGSPTNAPGGGGGGGAAMVGEIFTVTPGQTIPIIIGTGGANSTGGVNGSQTLINIGGVITLLGGQGGEGNLNDKVQAGGDGGAQSNSFTIAGGTGSYGIQISPGYAARGIGGGTALAPPGSTYYGSGGLGGPVGGNGTPGQPGVVIIDY